ncbi:hypothetical protein VTG60DRAFT_2534 [Thermothelomyces hinnuleus]
MTKNAQSKQGVENPTSGDIRCYTSQTAANVVTVPAGSSIHYISTQQDTYETSNTTIPANTPDGEYLLRVEQIALHMASQPNKAQFYLACTQIKITGGGNGNPSPLVALPGAYKSTDPGILVDIYSMKPESYQPPGPPVWRG